MFEKGNLKMVEHVMNETIEPEICPPPLPAGGREHRLFVETDDLRLKLEELEKFIASDCFNNIGLKYRILLRLQRKIMLQYYKILNYRIKLFFSERYKVGMLQKQAVAISLDVAQRAKKKTGK